MHIYSFEGFEVEATISTTTSFCLVTSNAAPVGITSDATVGALLITMHNHIVLLTSMAAASARTTTVTTYSYWLKIYDCIGIVPYRSMIG